MRTAFWASALFIAYVYVGYALLLMLWARLKGADPAGAADADVAAAVNGDDAPSLSIILAARNEARRLSGRLENLLSLDYPADRRQIIVVSDGSTDDTARVVEPFGSQVRLVSMPPSGKAAALNAGVALATGDVLVFVDARQNFAEDALRALAAPFVALNVGGVSGELILGAEAAAGRRDGRDRRADAPDWPAPERRTAHRRGSSSVSDGVGAYWKYEKRLRQLESHVGSMLGATGAIYALRRSLWRPLPPGAILDDVLAPMRAVLDGHRVVFEPKARAFDATAKDAEEETRRKIRTLAGNVQILWFEPRLLVPFLNPVWLQYVSHKVGRLLVPYALLLLFASSLALANTSVFYATALFGQVAFYLQGGYGAWLDHWQGRTRRQQTVLQRSGAVAYTIVVMNVSAVAGAGAALLGRRVWR